MGNSPGTKKTRAEGHTSIAIESPLSPATPRCKAAEALCGLLISRKRMGHWITMDGEACQEESVPSFGSCCLWSIFVYYVAQAVRNSQSKLVSSYRLSQPPRLWGYEREPPHLAFLVTFLTQAQKAAKPEGPSLGKQFWTEGKGMPITSTEPCPGKAGGLALHKG